MHIFNFWSQLCRQSDNSDLVQNILEGIKNTTMCCTVTSHAGLFPLLYIPLTQTGYQQEHPLKLRQNITQVHNDTFPLRRWKIMQSRTVKSRHAFLQLSVLTGDDKVTFIHPSFYPQCTAAELFWSPPQLDQQ